MMRTYRTVSEAVSTNSELKKEIAASPLPCFSVLRAVKQTGGRGRLGRSFFSPEGGLYFSASFPVRTEAENIPFFTLLCGLAAAEAIDEACGVKTRLKWPNDVYLNGKKLGGILCELISGRTLTVVAGIGIDLSVRAEDVPEELRGKMTSLFIERAPLPDPDVLMRDIVARLDRMLSVTDPAVFLPELLERSCSIGKKVSFTRKGAAEYGTFAGIAPDGAAVIRTESGEIVNVRSGEVNFVEG